MANRSPAPCLLQAFTARGGRTARPDLAGDAWFLGGAGCPGPWRGTVALAGVPGQQVASPAADVCQLHSRGSPALLGRRPAGRVPAAYVIDLGKHLLIRHRHWQATEHALDVSIGAGAARPGRHGMPPYTGPVRSVTTERRPGLTVAGPAECLDATRPGADVRFNPMDFAYTSDGHRVSPECHSGATASVPVGCGARSADAAPRSRAVLPTLPTCPRYSWPRAVARSGLRERAAALGRLSNEPSTCAFAQMSRCV